MTDIHTLKQTQRNKANTDEGIAEFLASSHDQTYSIVPHMILKSFLCVFGLRFAQTCIDHQARLANY